MTQRCKRRRGKTTYLVALRTGGMASLMPSPTPGRGKASPLRSRFRMRGRGCRRRGRLTFAFLPAETGAGASLLGEPDGSPYKTCRRGGACGSENHGSICARSVPLPSPVMNGRGKRGKPPEAAGVMGKGKKHSQPPCPDGLITLLLSATTYFPTSLRQVFSFMWR